MLASSVSSGSVSVPAARPQLPAPLQTLPDMVGAWRDGDLDFDAAAQLIVRAHERDGEHRDLPIGDLRTWAVSAREGKFALVPLAGHHAPRALRGAALAHLAARLGAPADFLRRLPAPLQLAALNWLLHDRDDSGATTLRLRGDEVAAIVSGRYAPLDASELVDTIRAGLVKFGILRDARVRAWVAGPVDNIRLVLPSESVAVEVGDVSAVGIDVTGSSFARSAVHVTPVLWRLVCSNGMRVAERRGTTSLRHVGDPRRLRDGVAEAIPAALVQARGTMDLWRRSVALMIEDVQRQVEELRELTAPERKLVEAELQAEGGTPSTPGTASLFQFVNAITAGAKSAAPARRLELESAAGVFLARTLASAR